MNREEYKSRIIDKQIADYLSIFGAVCIEGPKWCGKTWTSSFHSKSQIFLGDPQGNFQNRQLAKLDPSIVLSGEVPRLIDEWQEVPPLWDAVRHKVDQTGEKGQFILTGSSTPYYKGIFHSGAGRIARLRMSTMSLYESGHSTGDISLEELCNRKMKSKMTGEVELISLAEMIIRGGWPGSQKMSLEKASIIPKTYLKAILEDDVHRVDEIKRDPFKMQLLLRSLARNESTTVSNSTLKKDIRDKDEDDIDTNTIANYLDIFSRLFLIDNLLPYSSQIRSTIRVKQAEKRHFCDPSLACALLNITPQMLINDLETFGFLFESLCERDLKIYAQSFEARIFHYQDYKNREIDCVIELKNGDWCAVEIKLGASQIEKAADNLKKIYKEMEKDPKAKLPVSMIIICGLTNAAYKREDGIFVVPLTALKN